MHIIHGCRQDILQITAVGTGTWRGMEELQDLNIFWTPPWQRILEQFLLIQQFWLMGTTSIPQPVITTTQFPISAAHAGMPRKSSLRSAIFRLFSGRSLARLWRTCLRIQPGDIPRSRTGDQGKS